VTCDRFCSGTTTLVSFTNKTDSHDITEILLKVALNTKPTNHSSLNRALQYFLQGNMSGYASYDDALDLKYGEPYKVKLVVAN
jgi:hypothetical protein